MHLNAVRRRPRVRDEEVVLILFSLFILGGALILWAAMENRRKLREWEYRERIAMIERGLIPAPETDPAGFETTLRLRGENAPRANRWQSIGVIMIGVGLAMVVLISFAAGAARVGFGIGGAFALLGAAFLFNGMLLSRREPFRPPLVKPIQPRPHPSEQEPPTHLAP
jgi:hypothetical protein